MGRAINVGSNEQSLPPSKLNSLFKLQSFQLPELRRQSSCDSWLQYFEQTMPVTDSVSPFCSAKFAHIADEKYALQTGEAVNEDQGVDQGNLQASLKSEHRIRRKL